MNLGAEYTLANRIALRCGYRHSSSSGIANLLSTGIGYQGSRFIADAAYSQGSAMKGLSLQMGWRF
ncbi:MAG TPA: hypothetical protein VN030_14235 [Cellvibrio sp.]|nr:hypothetical protein [Cellvibrio sp.]